MTKLNHERDELRRIDEAKEARNSASRLPAKPVSRQAIQGFPDEQDSMGSALSEVGTLPFSLIIELAEGFEQAFVHNDLHVFKKMVADASNPDERSLLLRIFNGLLVSHKFILTGRSITLEKNGRVEWRPVGVNALRQNLQLQQVPKGKRIHFSDAFWAKFNDLM